MVKHKALHLGLDAEMNDNSDNNRQPAMTNDRSEFVVAPVTTAVAHWLKCCATNRKVAGSIAVGIIENIH